MTDETGAPQPKTSPADPPAANQHLDEPIPTTPDESAQAGDTGDDADLTGSTGAGHDQVQGEDEGVDATHGIPVAGTYAVGSSGPGASGGGGIPAIAPAGKPDGEVDTGA
jgi:hypothetical protein